MSKWCTCLSVAWSIFRRHRLEVVEVDAKHQPVLEHEVGQRYQSVFGSGIQWHTCGFEGWLAGRAGEGIRNMPGSGQVMPR
jgi:hypothetical protein